MNLIFITYMRFSYDMYKYVVPDCNNHGGWNSGQFTCGAVCWGSEVLSSGWDHLSDFNLNVDFEFGSISSPKSRNRWTLNTPGRAILIWGGEPKWEAAPSNRFKNLSSFASLPVQLSVQQKYIAYRGCELCWYWIAIEILAVLFCVWRRRKMSQLFPSYFEGTRPNQS